MRFARVKLAFRNYSTTASSAPVRVRFAPSPTGQLHLGGLRTALYNYLLARKTNGQFLLRIEDTDQTRYVPGAVEKLMASLSWAGIVPDEGPEIGGPHSPYYQSERTQLYLDRANQLIKDGHAYRCFCSTERLSSIREQRKQQGHVLAYDKHCSHLTGKQIQSHLESRVPFTVRHNVPLEGSTTMEDLVHGRVQFQHHVLDDTILLKSDGFPTYHLANVVDDHAMGITHVLRGEEWLPSTPKHLLLYKAFGWTAPVFGHLPLLLNENRAKLSKRSGHVHVEHYIDQGYLPEAVNNFVALLGWHPGQSQEEIMDMNDLVRLFDLNHLHRAAAVVDPMKLGWINKQHLLRRAESPDGLASLVDDLAPLVQQRLDKSASSQYLGQVISTVKDRIRVLKDIPDLCSYFFVPPDYTRPEAETLKRKLKQNVWQLVVEDPDTVLKPMQQLSFEEPGSIKDWIHTLSEDHGVKANHLMMVLRYIMTGTSVGAGVADTMHVLGKPICTSRLQNFVKSENK
ncbi:glutamyl-tRNA synthetase [Hesseltinella vesiculosa]|uniref:Glutamate--tRNA ligase, mitochondrial n=1 Tax=Hesseltinella vesiculosa TaxID=101127 RepID=A0A1X2GKR7_9FUNG|nr:glutamyl-tRNA synthetase [Hesseltinella vesiculosa]